MLQKVNRLLTILMFSLIGVFLGHILCCFLGGIAGRKGK